MRIMKYSDLVDLWNEELDEPWSGISEERKIEYAFAEVRRTGFLEIAEIAGGLGESNILASELASISSE